MSRLVRCLIFWGLASATTGCTICSNCDDYAYPTYGGKWERADRYRGRVGSLFEPAEYPPAAEEIAPGEVRGMESVLPEQIVDPPAYDDGQDPPPDMPLPEGPEPLDNLQPPADPSPPSETAPPTAPPLGSS